MLLLVLKLFSIQCNRAIIRSVTLERGMFLLSFFTIMEHNNSTHHPFRLFAAFPFWLHKVTGRLGKNKCWM